MPVYDDETEKDPKTASPSSLGEQEEDFSDQNDTPEQDNEADEGKDSSKEENVNERLQKGIQDAQEKDALAASSGAGGKKKGKSLRSRLRKKGVAAGAGVGIVSILITVAGFFGFLNVFKLDHLLQNIDSSTFSRYNASFSNRSDKYVQAYIQLRLNEIEGTQDHDTLLFRANKVDTNNPIRDWYRTLRTGNFERDIFGKQGISFQSIALQNPDGSITIRRAQIDFSSRPDLKQSFEASVDGQSVTGRNYTNAGVLSTDLNKFIDTLDADSRASVLTVFANDKETRVSLNKTLKDETRFFQVLKRRHVRKDIQNLTGISSWKFFETKRNKITDSKVALQQKIVRKIVPDSSSGKFIKCILGAGNCVASNDPQAPENRSGAVGAVAPDPDNKDQGPTEQFNDDGNAPTTTDSEGNVSNNTTNSYNAGETADELAGGIRDAVKDEIGDQADVVVLSPTKKIIAEQISSFVGGNIYTKAWSWAKKITKLHNNIVNSKFTKLVEQARLTQLAAIYTTYAIARDQAKTGEVSSEEVDMLMQTLDGAEKSEGWTDMSNNETSTASAQGATSTVQSSDEASYCKLGEEEKKLQKIQYFCHRPNGDSNAQSIETQYRNSAIFPLLEGIATVFNKINDSIVGSVINSVSGFADEVISVVLDPVINTALSVTGAQGKIETLVGYAMANIMSFLGAGPMWDGDQAGGLNFILAGSAATAETTTRGSGGARSTAATTAYTNKLAAAYISEENSNMSFTQRFASLDNSKSLASNALFGVATLNVGEKLSSVFSSFSSLPTMLMSVFSGRTYAAQNNTFNAAKWSGVDTYDIPIECQNLEPLDGNYAQKVVGVVTDSPHAAEAQTVVNTMRPKLTLELQRDNVLFWDLVYATINNPDTSEDIAGAIYNCALVDARVMGSMGYTNGYSDDDGLGEGASNVTPVTNVPSTISAPGLNGYTIPCAGQPLAVIRKTPAAPSANWSQIKESGIIGTNSAGQPIKVYIRNACTTVNVKTVIIVSSVHGSENGGQLVSHELLFNATLPPNVRIIAVPELNGFGIPSGARRNANGVDLNRNNDYLWSSLPVDAGGTNYKGTAPGSEPETAAINSFMLAIGKVSLSLHYHDNLAWVASVGTTPVKYATLYSQVSGLQRGNNSTGIVTQRGSLDAWFNKLTQSPTILVELGNDQSQGAINRNVDAAIELMKQPDF